MTWQRLTVVTAVLFLGIGIQSGFCDDSEDAEASLPVETEPADLDNLNFQDMMDKVQQTIDKEPTSHHKADELEVPDADKAHFFETFKGNWEARWGYSDSQDYPGRFIVGPGPSERRESLRNEEGLIAPQEAKKYAISAPFAKGPLVSTANGDFVAQYELRFHETIRCGGSYIKLLLAPGAEDGSATGNGKLFASPTFSAETPYVVMFGPDICATHKVHFIVKKRNPTSGKWVEHHLANPPEPVNDNKVHLYTLVVRRDDTYAIYVDQEVKSEGSMLGEGVFEPPFQPPVEIADPEDSRPADWVTKRTIGDPEDVRPSDWDDDAPVHIIDDTALTPVDWLVDEPLLVPDPTAVKPSDWDEEDDGVWEGPLVPNPVCAEVSGCGPWEAPMISNPDYRGIWSPRQIPNPDYVGEWSPRQIPNPDYFVAAGEHAPHRLAPIGAVGIEIWTMQANVQFDNFFIGNNPQDAAEWGDLTWGAKMRLRDALTVDDDEFGVWAYAVENPIVAGLFVLFGFIAIVLICIMCPSGSSDDEDEYEQEMSRSAQKKDQVGTSDASAKDAAESASPSAGRPRRRRVA